MGNFTVQPYSVTSKNRVCIDCDIAVDKRSKRCRVCNQLHLINKRYPLYRRPNLSCIDCGTTISYQSGAHGKGRCRNCYFEYRRSRAWPMSFKPMRPADRLNNGTFYENKDGNLVYAQDILIENQQGLAFTVAHA